jgi:hypothetical protein
MAANKVTAVHGRWDLKFQSIKFQAKTLSRPGNWTALFLDRRLEPPEFPEPPASMLSAHLAATRLAPQLSVPTFQSNMQSKSNDPGNPLDAAAN